MTTNSNKSPAAKKTGKKILGLIVVIIVAFGYLIKVKYLNSLAPISAEIKDVKEVNHAENSSLRKVVDNPVHENKIQHEATNASEGISSPENIHSVRAQIFACFGDGFQLTEDAPTKEQLLSAFFGPEAKARGMTHEHNWSHTHIKSKDGKIFILRDEAEAPKVFLEDEEGLPLAVELSQKERLMNFEQLLQRYLKKGEVIYRDSVNTYSLNSSALTTIEGDQGMIEFKYSGVSKHFECERENTGEKLGNWNCRCQSL